MKIKIGVMGSSSAAAAAQNGDLGRALGEAIAAQEVILLTGATTGLINLVGKTAREAGVFHIGISPGENQREHAETFALPIDACDAMVYTGFGLKGRNVVLVRSCDVVLFIAGSIGSLNEFTIAHDEGKIIGCLKGTGGVADDADYLLKKFSKDTGAHIFKHDDPNKLLELCLEALANQ